MCPVLQADAQDAAELMQACIWDDTLAGLDASNFKRGGSRGKKVGTWRHNCIDSSPTPGYCGQISQLTVVSPVRKHQ